MIVNCIGRAGRPAASAPRLGAFGNGNASALGGSQSLGGDGRAYIGDLSGQNRVTISTAAGTCIASFDFAPVAASRHVVPDAVCR